MTSQPSTPSLVERARQGDRGAFGELVERYRGRLEGWIRNRMGERVQGQMEAGDVLQETFARALRSLGTFEFHGDDSFVRWLSGIAENVILKEANRARRRRRLRLQQPARASGVSPSRAVRRDERLERLEGALAKLSPDYREVLRLAHIEGLKHEEIARRMNRSHAAVRQLVIRALRQLRERFGDTESLHLPDRPIESDGAQDGRG